MRNFPLMMAAATIALGLVPGVTSAQSSAQETRRSWLPMTTQGYVGANVGLSRFDSNCFGGSNCENDDVGFKIYTGGQFGRFLGAEVGFVDVGRAERGGGSLKARGANASLVGILPLGNVASVFGKVGAIYGFTRTTATAPVREGKDNGFGLSYGAGFGFDLSRSLQLVGEWDRYQFNSVNGDDEVQLVSIGMRYKF